MRQSQGRLEPEPTDDREAAGVIVRDVNGSIWGHAWASSDMICIYPDSEHLLEPHEYLRPKIHTAHHPRLHDELNDPSVCRCRQRGPQYNP